MRFFTFIAFALVSLVFLGKVYASNEETAAVVSLNEEDDQRRETSKEYQREWEAEQKDSNEWETDASSDALLSDAHQDLRELNQELKQKEKMILLLEKKVEDLSRHFRQFVWLVNETSSENFETQSKLRECIQTHPTLRRPQPNPFYTNPFQLNPIRLTPFKINPFQ